ncbi:MAG TPA: type IV toxin-antitoxin system AbiEi family antitoxin domain-containing protein [Solirubrobacterales bacterium]|nr:type IV toxin-antitoxin system AbiEi family antitoxin domain-containing protein [Solirubrobacterales bacterium]
MTGNSHRSGRAAGHDAVAALATRQHGVISRKQLRALGLTDAMIDHRLGSGLLQPLFRGVFAVGHRAITRHSLMAAAVLVCGRGAVVSHATAAELLGLWDRKAVAIDVTAPHSAGRGVQGIRWHGGAPLASSEVATRAAVPCTTVSRTLVDMAGQYGERTMRRLVEKAAFLRLLDPEEIDRVLARRRRRGAPKLRRILVPWRTQAGRTARLRSPMEALVLAASLEAGVRPPQCNVKRHIEGRDFEFDFFWEKERVVVETDGEETHGTVVAFSEDRKRDQIFMANGYRSARIAWSHMEKEPDATLARIVRILARPAG